MTARSAAQIATHTAATALSTAQAEVLMLRRFDQSEKQHRERRTNRKSRHGESNVNTDGEENVGI